MRAFLRVLRREVLIVAHRPLLWVATIGVPLFSALFISTIFGSGAIQNIPIGVVDEEFTPTSRSIIRTIDSSPSLNVTHHFTSSTEALAAIKQREIYGYVVLPHNLTHNMVQGTRATIPYYYHYAFMSIGAQVQSTLQTLLTIISIDPIVVTANQMGVVESVVESFIEPTNSDIHPIGNASLNYGTYLTEPFFFIMFQIVILTTMVYALGTESSHGKEWLTTANNNIFTAIVGKAVPYVCSFVASGMAALYIMSKIGNLTLTWGLVGAMVGLVVASISLALFIYSLYPHMALILSAVSMIGSLGATLSGVTFPINSMYPIFRHLALLLPIRHFTIITQNIFYTEGGYGAVWQHIAMLASFCLLPFITATRLRKSIISGSYEKSK
ncbi:MAG: ABC transporter permease [Alistipes sp.]|nr:ABC transporter permease [Alistipes sp.]